MKKELYSEKEAGEKIGVPAATLRNWRMGYTRGSKTYPPRIPASWWEKIGRGVFYPAESVKKLAKL